LTNVLTIRGPDSFDKPCDAYKRKRWVDCVASMGSTQGLVGKTEGRRQLEKPRNW